MLDLHLTFAMKQTGIALPFEEDPSLSSFRLPSHVKLPFLISIFEKEQSKRMLPDDCQSLKAGSDVLVTLAFDNEKERQREKKIPWKYLTNKASILLSNSSHLLVRKIIFYRTKFNYSISLSIFVTVIHTQTILNNMKTSSHNCTSQWKVWSDFRLMKNLA
jgi:hypothetical protein